MFKLFRRVAADDSGASATEYAILLSVVGAAVFAALTVFTTDMSAMFSRLVAHFATWVT